jgi:hypothetical protein
VPAGAGIRESFEPNAMAGRHRRVTAEREQTMNEMSKQDTVTTSRVDERNERPLRDDELDAVSGGKAGGDKQKYPTYTMSDSLISSY